MTYNTFVANRLAVISACSGEQKKKNIMLVITFVADSSQEIGPCGEILSSSPSKLFLATEYRALVKNFFSFLCFKEIVCLFVGFYVVCFASTYPAPNRERSTVEHSQRSGICVVPLVLNRISQE